jgi:hypothetical protein
VTYIDRDFYNKIAQGQYSNISPWTKIGYCPTIDTTERDVWSYGATQALVGIPTAAMTMYATSSEATADKATVLATATADAGGSTTTLVDADGNFVVAGVQVGDVLILDKTGTTPEWGYITTVAATVLTCSNGFSSGGVGTLRGYDVLDVNAAGQTGALAVKTEYLTTAYAEKSAITILNGTAEVAVAADMFRVNSFRVIATGSGNKPVGNLSLKIAAAGTTRYSYMLAGYTRARNSFYTVPAGKTLYITEWNIGWATPNDTKFQTARFYMRANIEPSTSFNVGSIFYPYKETIVTNAQELITFLIPGKYPAKTDIRVCGLAFNAGSGAAASVMRGYLVS